MNERVRVKARFAEGEEVPTITGPLGRGKPDSTSTRSSNVRGALRRPSRTCAESLLPEEWTGYPLRKDYGLQQQDT